jgi:hypothetical protein
MITKDMTLNKEKSQGAMIDFEFSPTSGEDNSPGTSTKANSTETSINSSSAAPAKTPRPTFHLTRRLSTRAPLITSFESQLPLPDAASIVKFDSLLEQFPKPPIPTETSRSSASHGKSSSSGQSSSSWGLKGFAERFNLFSKS